MSHRYLVLFVDLFWIFAALFVVVALLAIVLMFFDRLRERRNSIAKFNRYWNNT